MNEGIELDGDTPRAFILCSSEYGMSLATRELAAADLCLDLLQSGFPFCETWGSFRGVEEEGFMVTGRAAGHVVHLLAKRHYQAHYLAIAENDRNAFLVDTDTGHHQHLGRMDYVGNAAPEGDWTLVGGRYYQAGGGDPSLDLPEGL